MKPKWEFISCHRMDDFPDIIAEVRCHGHITLKELEQITEDMLAEVNEGEREFETRICGSYITVSGQPYPVPILEIVLRAITTPGYRTPVAGQSPDAAERLRLRRIAEGRG